MARAEELLKHIDPSAMGIEVAPYFNPALPKSKGFNTLILDVFDTAKLREYAARDPLIADTRIAEIEAVDIVGDASNIGEMVEQKGLSGQIHHVVSSHNFEHLPNPVKFLHGCTTALKPGGMLSMAVPDCRACFDYFRMPTRLGDWLSSFYTNSSQPTPAQVFDLAANRSVYVIGTDERPGCNIATDDPQGFRLVGDLKDAFDRYLDALKSPGTYHDTHCTIMFNHSLELMLRDLRYLGLLDLEIVEISPPTGHEFFVHLRKTGPATAISPVEYQKTRERLLRLISEGLGASPYRDRAPRQVASSLLSKLRRGTKSAARRLVGDDTYKTLREANRQRRLRLKQPK